MDWVESQINNEDIFPIDKGTAKNARAIVTLKGILGKQLGLAWVSCSVLHCWT